PLVLLLEDLHWSDSATIDLLGMLARRREPARLLVLGTYRPADVAGAAHPLKPVKQELQVHGHCEEMPLEFLSLSAVDQYLLQRFPGHRFPPELARVLHRTTDGNPLFLVNTIDYLVGQGQLREGDGLWVAGRYAFIQTLYQQVLYAHVSIGDRPGLHLRTGQRLERGYAERAGEIAGELAMHFAHGRDFERAARYRRQAGEHALRQYAYREAADHATRALDLLKAWPESPERTQQELALQVMLGAALTATHGYGALEVARAYARARELCEHVGDTVRLLPVLLGLGR